MGETNGYPILMRLKGRRCVVVGGGKVAARKVSGLLEAGAQVIVISPQFDESLITLAAQGRIEARQTAYTSGMLAELRPLLVFAATNSAEVNQQVVDEAHTLNILVDAVDNADNSDFTNMAVIRRGAITVGIATGGASPALTAQLKARVSAVIGEEYAVLARWLAELRPLVQQRVLSETERAAFWREVLDSAVLDALRGGDETGARAIIDRLWAEYSA